MRRSSGNNFQQSDKRLYERGAGEEGLSTSGAGSWLSSLSSLRALRCMLLIVIGSILIFILQWCAQQLHQQTYIWQCTEFAAYVRPVMRQQCFVRASNFDGDFTKEAVSKRKLRIALLNLYRDMPSDGSSNTERQTSGSWNEPLMQRVLHNRRSYCERHGYTLIDANDMIGGAGDRPAAWTKLLALQKHVQSGLWDYIMYMDMDVVIMDPSKRLEDYLRYMAPPNHFSYAGRSVSTGNLTDTKYFANSTMSQAAEFNWSNASREIDFLFTEDWNGLNSGVFIVRSSPFSAWFLGEAWRAGSHLVGSHCGISGIKLPFEYEQRALHFMLDTDVWQKRRLPSYVQVHGTAKGSSPNNALSLLRQHVAFAPQCAMNSYILHPLYWKGDRETSQYVDGDFLIHFAGKKGTIKTNLMNHYLDEAAVHGEVAAKERTLRHRRY